MILNGYNGAFGYDVTGYKALVSQIVAQGGSAPAIPTWTPENLAAATQLTGTLGLSTLPMPAGPPVDPRILAAKLGIGPPGIVAPSMVAPSRLPSWVLPVGLAAAGIGLFVYLKRKQRR